MSTLTKDKTSSHLLNSLKLSAFESELDDSFESSDGLDFCLDYSLDSTPVLSLGQLQSKTKVWKNMCHTIQNYYNK